MMVSRLFLVGARVVTYWLCYIEDVDLNIDTEVYPLFRRLILSLLLSTMMWTGTLLHDVCGLPVANFSQAIFSKLAHQQADSDELLTDNSNYHQQASKPAGCPSHRHSPWVDSEPGDLTTDEAVALLISTLQIAFYVHCGDPPQKQIIASALPVVPNHGKCEIYIAYQSLLI